MSQMSKWRAHAQPGATHALGTALGLARHGGVWTLPSGVHIPAREDIHLENESRGQGACQETAGREERVTDSQELAQWRGLWPGDPPPLLSGPLPMSSRTHPLAERLCWGSWRAEVLGKPWQVRVGGLGLAPLAAWGRRGPVRLSWLGGGVWVPADRMGQWASSPQGKGLAWPRGCTVGVAGSGDCGWEQCGHCSRGPGCVWPGGGT